MVEKSAMGIPAGRTAGGTTGRALAGEMARYHETDYTSCGEILVSR